MVSAISSAQMNWAICACRPKGARLLTAHEVYTKSWFRRRTWNVTSECYAKLSSIARSATVSRYFWTSSTLALIICSKHLKRDERHQDYLCTMLISQTSSIAESYWIMHPYHAKSIGNGIGQLDKLRQCGLSLKYIMKDRKYVKCVQL